MGKKTGATQRVKKRVDAIVNQLTREKSEQADLDALQNKADAELFVLDTGAVAKSKGLGGKKKSLVGKTKREDKRHRISEQDQRLMRKWKTCMSSNVTPASTATRTSTRFKGGQVPADFNLWDDREYTCQGQSSNLVLRDIPIPTGSAAAAGTAPLVIQSIPAIRLRKDIQQPSSMKATSTNSLPSALHKKHHPVVVKVDVAQPGQSYRPDKEQHQDVIGEALAMELRRQDMMEYNKTPIYSSDYFKSNTMDVNSISEEEYNDDDEDSNENDDDAPQPVAARKKDKLTRTQRNKQKRARQELCKIQKRKREKKFMAAVEEAKWFSKELKQREAMLENKREQLKKIKTIQDLKPVGVHVFQEASKRDPIHAPSLPVALTLELEQGGTLRSLRTKGSLITDRLESFVSRNILSTKVLERKKVVQGKKRKIVGRDEYLLT
jgi:nucleolar protein 53